MTAAPGKRPLRIVIADDAEEVRHALLSFFREQGYDVVGEARDGFEAVELAASLQPDAVVLDLSMPGMDGLEAAPRIRRRCPRTRIVVLSGFDERTFGDEALAAGADLYFEKNLKLEELAFALTTLCSLPHSDSDERALIPAGSDGEMLDALGRELRTPVSVIEYLVARMRENAGSLTPDALRDGLDTIGHNVAALGSLIRSFADAASIEGAGLEMRPETVDLAAISRRTVEDLGSLLEAHPVRIDAPGELWAIADPGRVGSILGHLLSNSVKFSGGTGPIQIVGRAHADRVEITVRDHGPGIPEDRREEVFARFTRLSPSVKGLGLGLFIARGLARAQGGDLTAGAAPGGGAAMTLRLPAAARGARLGVPGRVTPAG